jgi:hypothetical protein
MKFARSPFSPKRSFKRLSSALGILTLLLTANESAVAAPAAVPQKKQSAATQIDRCRSGRTITLSKSPDTILIMSRTSTKLPQDRVVLADFSTVLKVETPGVIDVTLKLEVEHRGQGYDDVIGIGAFMAYQYAPTVEGLDKARMVYPDGWVGGTNIRDIRDHYGQINIVSALDAKPGFYRLCVYGSAHTTLSTADGLAEVLVEHQVRPMNTLRLSFKPGGRLIIP